MSESTEKNQPGRGMPKAHPFSDAQLVDIHTQLKKAGDYCNGVSCNECALEKACSADNIQNRLINSTAKLMRQRDAALVDLEMAQRELNDLRYERELDAVPCEAPCVPAKPSLLKRLGLGR